MSFPFFDGHCFTACAWACRVQARQSNSMYRFADIVFKDNIFEAGWGCLQGAVLCACSGCFGLRFAPVPAFGRHCPFISGSPSAAAL
jgi:hypothetical protein